MSPEAGPTAADQTSRTANPGVVAAALVVAYFLAGYFAPWIAQPGRVIVPAAGVAMAALFVFGARYGIAVWVAAVVVGITSGMSFLAALLVGAVCALEAAVGALLLRGARFRPAFDRVRDVVVFGALGVFVAPALAAVVGGFVLQWTGEISSGTLGASIVHWWLSGAAGVLMFAPVVLALLADWSGEGWARMWSVEGGFSLAVMVLVAIGLFGGKAPQALAEAALLVLLPFLVWGIFRFGLHGAAWIMALVAAGVAWSSGRGVGIFAYAESAHLWTYLIILGFVGLVTWALVARQRSAFQRFQAVFENSSDGLVLFEGGRVAELSPAAVRLFGTRTSEFIVGHDIGELSPKHQPDGTPSSGAARDHMAEADAKGHDRFEWMFDRQDGTSFPAEIALARVVSPGSSEHLAVIRDLSDQKARQRSLEFERDQAKADAKAKTAYLADVSHRIRTQLNTNLGFARIIAKNEELSAEQKGYAQKVVDSGKILLDLIDDVLERSRIEADRMGAFGSTAFDPRKLLSDLLTIYRLTAKEKGVSLELDVDEAVLPSVVAERHKLEDVLTVLVGNAVKATSKGEVRVHVTPGEGSGEGDELSLVIEVADTGSGLTSDELAAIFHKTEREPEESGEYHRPGLPEARDIARDMGGELTAESSPGEGSRFRLVVPARTPELGKAAEGRHRVVRLASSGPSPRILIVDDTQENRMLLQGILTRVGFETQTASNGVEAIAEFGAWEPDLILMDQNMPVMDGLEATRRIKASERGRNTPLIMVTAMSFGVSREQIMAGGADGFVRVPYHETELLREIQRHLNVAYVYDE